MKIINIVLILFSIIIYIKIIIMLLYFVIFFYNNGDNKIKEKFSFKLNIFFLIF